MSSEAETKGDQDWRRWGLLPFMTFVLGILFGIGIFEVMRVDSEKPGQGPGTEADAMLAGSAILADIDHSALEAQQSTKKPVAVKPLSVAGESHNDCDVSRIHLDIDPRQQKRAEELRQLQHNNPYPTFEELYKLIVNKDYSEESSIWHTFPNAYNLNASFRFPYSNLKKAHVDKVMELVGRPIKFAVEVGSFHGHSAVWQALALDQHGFKEAPLLCIDPWTGALGQLLNRDDWDKKLTPGEISEGRSTSYWQFMLNMHLNIIEQKNIGPKHVIPLVATSIVGARFLMALGLTPDMIFLDSAHEEDETFIELTMYWHVLAEGGVLFGDDLSWAAVKNDVTRFVKRHNLTLQTEGVIWMLKKPESTGALSV